jgi:hypothetical protein
MYKVLLVLLFSSAVFAEIVGGVAITVKGNPITMYEIKQEMQLSNVSAAQASEILIRKKLEQIEIDERNIEVSASEIYDDIKETAARNNMSVSQFYEAIRNSNGLTSSELKKKIRQKLLSQKLYSAIAYSSISQPSDEDIKEYYELNKNQFVHPSTFDVVIYTASSAQRLKEKIENPMFHSPDIQTKEQKLEYVKIAPELASLLEQTPLNSFTQIIPNGQNGFMSFYVKEVDEVKESGVEDAKNQIISMIMSKKRESVLGEFFERMKLNTDIKKIRMPK